MYDALRWKRYHKPSMPHAKAIEILLDSPGQFEPMLLTALHECAGEWERTFRDTCE